MRPFLLFLAGSVALCSGTRNIPSKDILSKSIRDLIDSKLNEAFKENQQRMEEKSVRRGGNEFVTRQPSIDCIDFNAYLDQKERERQIVSARHVQQQMLKGRQQAPIIKEVRKPLDTPLIHHSEVKLGYNQQNVIPEKKIPSQRHDFKDFNSIISLPIPINTDNLVKHDPKISSYPPLVVPYPPANSYNPSYQPKDLKTDEIPTRTMQNKGDNIVVGELGHTNTVSGKGNIIGSRSNHLDFFKSDYDSLFVDTFDKKTQVRASSAL